MTDEPDTGPSDEETAANVAAAIKASYSPRPLTEDERKQIELDNYLWHENQRWLAEQRQLERELAQAEADERARREASIAAQEARKKVQREASERMALAQRNREETARNIKLMQMEEWQRQVDAVARNTVIQQHRQALLDDLDRTINPPPPPEPTIVYVESPQEEMGALSFVRATSWRPKPI